MTHFAETEAAIRQLHAKYTDAVWRKDLDAFGNCFTEDAEWRISGLVLNGRDEIVELMRNGFAHYKCILLNFRTPLLEVGDGVASGRTYVSEQSIFNDGSAYAPIGIYYERFVEQGGEWKFKWRLFHTCYVGPPDMSGELFEVPDFGAPPAMPPLDAPSYKRTDILKK